MSENQKEKVDVLSWVWKFLGSSFIGVLFSVATVFAVSMFNTLSNNVNNVNATCAAQEGKIGVVQGRVTGLENGITSIKTNVDKLVDLKASEVEKINISLSDFRERCVRLEEKVKQLEDKTKALEDKIVALIKPVDSPKVIEKK